jgi:hypothetical protein
MECARHGIQKPAFICKHLLHGVNIGFHEPEEDPDPEWPFKNAWCSQCEAVAVEQGGWNDVSEGFAQVMSICEGCYEEIKQRNT